MSDVAFDAVATARALMRTTLSASLATLGPDGVPHVSLIAVAPDMAGAPMTLISRLAVHTANLEADRRAAILFDRRGEGDALSQPRITLRGRMAPAADEALKARFLAHHPEAARYAGFADFALWRLSVEEAHLVAGFGRIVTLSGADVLTDVADAGALAEAEADAVARMNADHADAVSLYAERLAGAGQGAWRFAAFDPDGMTLIAGGRAVHIGFPRRVTTADGLRGALAELARTARVG